MGTEEFREELLAVVNERIGPSHFGEQRQETAEQKAEGLLMAELEKIESKEETLIESYLLRSAPCNPGRGRIVQSKL